MDINDDKKSKANPPPLPENFRDSLNNLSMNQRNIKNYLLYLYKWTNDIIQKPKNPEILNKYVDTAFAFLRDLQKYPNLREMTYDYEFNTITTPYIVNKIKETNKFIINKLYTSDIRNQAKFIEMNTNLNSGNFRGGIMKRTNKKRSNKNRTNKKIKKTYKRRSLIKKRNK
jgi:hypothetical protein